MKYLQNKQGVSPVIGIILMVAVTVALVALAANLVFDLGGDVSETPDATVDLEQNGDEVTATVVRNENVDGFTISAEESESEDFGPDAGDSTEIDVDDEGDTVQVIAEMPDGSEEVIRTSDTDDVSSE